MLTFFRYLIIAGLAYIVDMGGYYLLIKLHMIPLVANIIVKVVAAICGFYLHRRFTYRITDRLDVSSHAKKYFGTALVYTPASTVTLFLLMLVIPDPIYAKALSDILLFLLTYWITTKFTFNTNRDPKRLVK
jgi:putative flippase GtrA